MTMQSIINPKASAAPGWRRARGWTMPPQLTALGFPCEAWEHPKSGLFCLSAVEVAAEAKGLPAKGPAYHLSISLAGQRCTSADALFVLAAFDLTDALEDNHVPSGRVRNYRRYVADSLSGYACMCVDDEPAIVEDRGDFMWRGITR